MVRPINIMVVKRLAVVWLVLSVALGVGVYYLEVSRLNDIVVNLILGKVNDLEPRLINGLVTNDPDLVVKLQREMDRLVSNDFVLVEIFRTDGTQVALSSAGNISSEVFAAADLRAAEPSLLRGVRFQRFEVDDNTYMRVLVPLRNSHYTIVGYFEGVYSLDDATLGGIYDRVYHTLLLVILIILAIVLAIYPIIVLLNKHLFALSQDLLRANVDLLEVLGSAIAMRDSTTNSHNYRVTLYAIALAKALNLRKRDIRKLTIGAFLHDVGKIGVPDRVLQKRNKLERGEIDEMRNHVSLGQYIIEKSSWLAGAREVVQYHHEKFDGSGYLNGLKGDQIPVNARIFAVVDVFDALTSKRPYKEAYSLEYAVDYLKAQRGSHFDPVIVDKFLEIVNSHFHQYSQADDDVLEKALRDAIYTYFFRPGTNILPLDSRS